MKAVRGLPKVKAVTREEGRKMLDREARRSLNMSGEEFLRKWKRKEFKDPDSPEIMKLAFLIPFGG